ncbi:MAG: cyclic nucleotide-binding/CBS domain-containing protein [Desulfomonile tiedjei]|nr:cyclic nucleotide-binding/CBS domain-containing protein [Desulfomonile tiedjei]
MLLQFLGKTLPFKDLDSPSLERLATRWVIDYFPKGSLIFEQGVTEVTHLFLIQKGGVKAYLTRPDTVKVLVDFGGEGAAFGASSLIRGHKADLNVEAVEDTFCFLLARGDFLKLMQSNPRLSHYYLTSFSEDFVLAAYSELRQDRVKAKNQERLYLFNKRVQDLVKGPVEAIAPSATVQQAAARMSAKRIGSLLVRDDAGSLIGIVTDKDLRSKVVAKGLDPGCSVADIMASPVQTIPARSLCFDAMLAIMQRQVGHLVVEHQDEIVGVVTAHDIVLSQGSSPVNLFKEIASQTRIEDLHELSRKIPFLVRSLIEEGGKAPNITRIITVLNDSLLDRLFSLLRLDFGPPPVPFCWLMLGSEGRKEQTFRTDQDNSLVYQDPRDPDERRQAESYFEAFVPQAVDHLIACGYPPCKNETAASNPRWCKPYSTWESYFSEWVSTPDPHEVRRARVFFDFRGGHGHSALADGLREKFATLARHQHTFLVHLAGDCLLDLPPLSFFRNFIVEKDGERSNRLDLKNRGLLPIVNFARLMALCHGIQETNTFARMELLAKQGHIPADLYADIREAYEFQTQLNLVHQLRMAESGQAPDSFIDPGDLSDLERKTLKDAFSVINRLRGFIKEAFPSVI